MSAPPPPPLLPPGHAGRLPPRDFDGRAPPPRLRPFRERRPLDLDRRGDWESITAGPGPPPPPFRGGPRTFGPAALGRDWNDDVHRRDGPMLGEPPLRREIVRDVPMRGPLSREEMVREALVREELVREGLIRERLARKEPTREALVREILAREDRAREDRAREELAREASLRDGLLREGLGREGPLRDGMMRQGPIPGPAPSPRRLGPELFHGAGGASGPPRDEMPPFRGIERMVERHWVDPQRPPPQTSGSPGMGPPVPFTRRPELRGPKRLGPMRRPRTPPRSPPSARPRSAPFLRDVGPRPLGHHRPIGVEPGPTGIIDRREVERSWIPIAPGNGISDIPPHIQLHRQNPSPSYDGVRSPRARDHFPNREFSPPRGINISQRSPRGDPRMNQGRDGPPLNKGRSPPFLHPGNAKPSMFRSPDPSIRGAARVQRPGLPLQGRPGSMLPRFNHDRDRRKGGGIVKRRLGKPSMSSSTDSDRISKGVSPNQLDRRLSDRSNGESRSNASEETKRQPIDKGAQERTSDTSVTTKLSEQKAKEESTSKPTNVDTTVKAENVTASTTVSPVKLAALVKKEAKKAQGVELSKKQEDAIANKKGKAVQIEKMVVGEDRKGKDANSTASSMLERQKVEATTEKSAKAEVSCKKLHGGAEESEKKEQKSEHADKSNTAPSPLKSKRDGDSVKSVDPAKIVPTNKLFSQSIAVKEEKKPAKNVDIVELNPSLFSSTNDILTEMERIDEAITTISLKQEKLCPPRTKPSLPSLLLEKEDSPANSRFFSQIAAILDRNQTKAKASAAAFRPICANTEVGLDAEPPVAESVKNEWLQKPIPKAVLAGVTQHLTDVRDKRATHNLKIRRKYCRLQKRWRRKLKKLDDAEFVEKKKENLERDRYLVGCNFLRSSGITRSSSARLPPSTQEIDTRLRRIKAEGGSPGNVDIWSTTLADIPDQDRTQVPYEGSSVRIDDPLMDHFAAQAVNPWTREEKLIFLEKYIVYQKNFRKIATFLKHKSNGDCVKFYYKNKISLGLKDLPREMSAVKKKELKKAILEERAGFKPAQILPEASSGILVENFERRVLAGETEGRFNMYSRLGWRDEDWNDTPTRLALEPEWSTQESALFMQAIVRYGLEFQKVASFVRSRSSEECKEYYNSKKEVYNLDQFIPTDAQEPPAKQSATWTLDETLDFPIYLKIHGKDWGMIAQKLGTKTIAQVKEHWQEERRREAQCKKWRKKNREEKKSRTRQKSSKSSNGGRRTKERVGGASVSDGGVGLVNKRTARDAGLSEITSIKKSRDRIEKVRTGFPNGTAKDEEIVANGGRVYERPSALEVLASSAARSAIDNPE